MATILELLRLQQNPSVENEAGYARLNPHSPSDAPAQGFAAGEEGDETLRHLLPPYTPMYANQYQLERKALDEALHGQEPGCMLRLCFVVSICGFVFLSIVGRMLSRNTPYIETHLRGDQLSASVYGAAAMYMVSMFYCGFMLVKARCHRRSPLFDSDVP
eukprot:TRINITY_DN31203_c0_g1_i1.p1 TRINITY_DN31203_c0_g1~~TRINITY_DN31203_c0_g1_i1.p1  ORF type:complete len:170 (-),score=45.69 TRINITY_DN31203_c0_g1_i1:606-1085(-)